jgi:hypothetical protein
MFVDSLAILIFLADLLTLLDIFRTIVAALDDQSINITAASSQEFLFHTEVILSSSPVPWFILTHISKL